MSHRIHEVIDADSYPEGRVLLRIPRIISPFPGIAQVRIEGRRDHDASLIVVDTTPLGHITVIAVWYAGSHGPLARNLVAVVQVVNGVEDGIFVREFDHRTVRENSLHALNENLPIAGPPEVIA